MDMLGKVRRMHLRDKLSISEIAKRTGSYQVAMLNGVGWNALSLTIAVGLLWRPKRRPPASLPGNLSAAA